MNATESLKITVESLDNRVRSIEKRLPLVENTTTQLHSMLSINATKYEFSTQNCSANGNDFVGNGQYPTTWKKQNLDKPRWQLETLVASEGQYSNILPAGGPRSSVVNQSNRSRVARGYSEERIEQLNTTNLGTSETHFSGSVLDPLFGICDDTELLAIGIPGGDNLTGVDFSVVQEDNSLNSNLQTCSEVAAKAIHPPPQHLPQAGAVQGLTDCAMTEAPEPPEKHHVGRDEDGEAFDVTPSSNDSCGVDFRFPNSHDFPGSWSDFATHNQ